MLSKSFFRSVFLDKKGSKKFHGQRISTFFTKKKIFYYLLFSNCYPRKKISNFLKGFWVINRKKREKILCGSVFVIMNCCMEFAIDLMLRFITIEVWNSIEGTNYLIAQIIL